MSSRPELPSVIFEVTSRCNLACRYCYNVWKAPGGPPPARDGYAQAMRTLARLFRVAEVRHVTMSGGEPFLAERFAELVLACRLKGKSVTVISNGTSAGRADYEQLHALGVNLFEFPFHSADPSAHDAMTGKPGCWELSRRSIEDVLAIGGDVVAAVIVSRINAAGIGDTLRAVARLGVRRVMLNRFNVGGRGIAEREALSPTPDQLADAFAQADAAVAELGSSVTSNVCTPRCLLEPTRYRRIAFATCSTDVRRRPMTLDAAGDLRFCNHSPVVMGNIFRDDFASMLSSSYAQRWSTAVPSYCARCEQWSRCLGGCRAAAEQLGGSVEDVDPILTALSGASDSMRR